MRDGILRARTYLTKRALYQVITIVLKRQEGDKEMKEFYDSMADRFLKSFKLAV